MRIALTAVLLVTALHAAASGLSDITRSMRERAWEAEYIPESGDSIPPLTEYDEYEVVELFRAVTIEELEAALPETYPMPWLEETLRDTGIPWEDRYWLDRRVRAAISQNLHVFYDTEGNPVHVDADGIFPGEFYWREHMIADPEGWNVPEGAERPVALENWDIGHLYNAYGERVGEIAVPVPVIALSRDGNIGVITSGGNDSHHPRRQPLACFLHSDGSFREIPLDTMGVYDAVISADGSVAAFSCRDRFQLSSEERNARIGPVYVFDSDANLQAVIIPPVALGGYWRPKMTADGRYLCHMARGANTCLVDCVDEIATLIDKPIGYYDRNTCDYYFSPDGNYLCLGGATTGRILDLGTSATTVYLDSTSATEGPPHEVAVCCSNEKRVVALTYIRGERPNFWRELVLHLSGSRILTKRIPPDGVGFTVQTEVSPNGHYLLVNPTDAAHGYPTEHSSYDDVYNLPFVALRIEGR